VPGCDLHDWLVQRRPEGLAVDEAIGFLEQICRGVQAIHDNGAVHQDLKPSNVLVGPGFRVVVTDLGLARVVDPTSPGVELTVGTPLYSAPEVILGHTIPPEHAARVDVYALGVIAYQLLTGCYMFPIDDTTQLLRYQTRSMPVPPSEVRLDLPERFDDVIFGALEKDPMLRIPTAAAFRQALMEAREVTERKAIAAPRIIVVDDDPGFRQWVTRVLQATVGYAEIIELDSGSQACDIARRFKASLMIAALELPELNGIELTAELRGDPATRDLPIVVTTAVGGAPDWKMLQSMGADGFLIKPFPDTALTGLVRQVLSVRRA
jgi:serine/threonine-protein kinase